MKIRPAKKFINLIAAILLIAALVGCKSRSEKFYAEAQSAIEKGHFRIGLDLLEKSFSTEKDSKVKYKYLIEASRIARFEIHDFERAIRYNREIIKGSESESDRLNAQEAIAEIYFENLQSFEMALKEYQILEPRYTDHKKKEKINLRLAQLLYYTGEYKLALEQAEGSLKYATEDVVAFLKVKAQIFLAQKEYEKCIQVYTEIRERNPTYFAKENLFIATSIVFEENEQYDKALEFLKENESEISDKAYLELRYKRLSEKQKNKPLSSGKRK